MAFTLFFFFLFFFFLSLFFSIACSRELVIEKLFSLYICVRMGLRACFCCCLFMLSFAYFSLMRVLCPFLVLGSKFYLHMLFYFPRGQCPFFRTCVIQRLYLFTEQKLKTLYCVNAFVKLFPLLRVGWSKICGLFKDLLLAKQDVQRAVSLVYYAVQPRLRTSRDVQRAVSLVCYAVQPRLLTS